MQVMRMRTIVLAPVVAMLLLTAGAVGAQDVKYNFMPGTDFSKYHTYKWVAIEGASHPNQIMDQEIKQAADSQLAAKGLTKTDGEKADLFVGYQVATKAIDPSSNQEKNMERLNKAMAKLLKNYPPKQK